jgi:predicted Zn-dependent protease
MTAYGNTNRMGWIEVRVGDYKFDNTLKQGMLDTWSPDLDFDRTNINLRLPVDDDIEAIRTQLWLVTDTMYKAAVADYLNKKGRKVYMIEKKEPVNDFSREEPVRFSEAVPDWEFDADAWKSLVQKASAVFKDYPTFLKGNVSVTFSKRVRRLVNTEGTRIVDGGRFFTFQIYAQTQAEDGQKLENFYNFNERSAQNLPDEKTVMEKVRLVADELLALSLAEKLLPYTGPAILDPSLAGVFFHEAVGHRLEGERQDDTDEGQTFQGKVGEKVLPEFLSLLDDPTLEKYEGQELFGAYRFDDEGVPAEKVTLVEDGVLRSFLMSRQPIEGVAGSNGHGRGSGTLDPIARMGNTIVMSTKVIPAGQLKKQLLKLARRQGRPFALILRKARGGETSTTKYSFQAFKHSPVLIYKVDVKTGKETLVRGAEVVGTPLVSLNKVVVAGDDPEVFNGYCGAESGWVPVSVIAPSLLISEIEVQRTNDKPVRPPILEPPFAEK